MPTYVPYDETNTAPTDANQPSSPFVPYEGPALSSSAPKAAATKPQRSLTDELIRQLGLTARAGITGVTGTGAAIGDAAVGAANMLGANLPMPSQAQQQMMTRLGLPKPEGTAENLAGLGASMLAGGMDPVLNATQKIAAQLAPAGFISASKTPSQNVVTKELHDAGYQLPPTEMQGGPITRGAEGLGGSGRIASLAEYRNQDLTQSLAKQALNLPPTTRLTADTLQNQANDLIKQGYEPIREIPKIGIGSSYRSGMNAIANDLGGSASFPLASRDQVRTLVNNYMFDANGRPLQAYTGADALKEIKLLRQSATQEFKPGGDALLGEAMRRISTVLEDNIETSLKGQGSNLLSAFRDARIGLAKNFAVERMLSDPNTGMVSTPKAAQLLKSGTPLTDELLTIAKAGAPMYARATGVPTHGKPPAFNYGDQAFGLGGLASLGIGGGSLAAPLLSLPVVRTAARYGVLSPPIQAMLARNLTKAPSMFGAPAANVMAGMPQQLSPLFSQGQQ